MCDQQRLRSACVYAQSDQSICLSLEYSLSVKLLTEHLLEALSLKGGFTGSSESTLVKISNCCKSHAAAQLKLYFPISNVDFLFLSPTTPKKYPPNISVLQYPICANMNMCANYMN